MNTAVCFSASSDIARATLLETAPRRALLAGRDLERVKALGDELHRRHGTQWHGILYEATSALGPTAVLNCATSTLGEIDTIFDFTGTLNPADCQKVNYLAGIRVVDEAGALLEKQGRGNLVVLSSVAAVRPRAQNLAYAASKAGLDAYARTYAHTTCDGVLVMVVRPGHVHTRMTAGLPAAPFAVTAAQVAAAIRDGLERRRQVVWVPKHLGVVMSATRVIPDRTWVRMSTGAAR